MKVLDAQDLETYLRKDVILDRLRAAAPEDARRFGCQSWLLQSAPKRMIYERLYGDLLAEGAPRRRVLDIGGGFTSISREIVGRHDYRVLDFMAHDSHTALRDEESRLERRFWIDSDWASFEESEPFDLVIANDIFPNVDQRLGLFLDRFLGRCAELRLLLTFHDEPRWYRVRRVDGDEIFHMLAWDGAQLSSVLERHHVRLVDPDLAALARPGASIFPNGRRVCAATLEGDLATREESRR